MYYGNVRVYPKRKQPLPPPATSPVVGQGERGSNTHPLNGMTKIDKIIQRGIYNAYLYVQVRFNNRKSEAQKDVIRTRTT